MQTLSSIERAVLDVTATRSENLEQIYLRLQSSSQPVPLSRTADALISLAQKGLLCSETEGEPEAPDAATRLYHLRFEATPEGRKALARDRESLDSSSERRSYHGAGRGLMPDLPFEIFKENRREMSIKFSADQDR